MNCAECGKRFREELLDDVPCDGCEMLHHRGCLNYCLIDVVWADHPKAFAFCEECYEDDGTGTL